MTKPAIKVLMIEDNDANALLLENSLGRDALNAFEIMVAERLQTGLDALRWQKFDLVLLDLGLPDSQGLETFETLHGAFPDIPVVVLSSLMDDRVALESVQAGAQDYLVKGSLSWEIAPRTIRYAIERHRAQTALRQSEARFRAVFENSHDGILFTDAKGTILTRSPSYDLINGFTNEDRIGHSGFETVHPEDLDAVRQEWAGLLKRPGAVRDLKYRIQHKDGTWRWVESLAQNLLDNPNVQAIVVTTRDITERKRAESEIHSQAERMAALYEITHDLVAEHDVSKLLQIIVERAARLLNADGGGLYLSEPEEGQVRCVVSYNTPHDYTGTILKYGEGSAGRVAQTGLPLVINDYSTWEGRSSSFEENKPFHAVLSVPMKLQDNVIGVLHVLSFGWNSHFTDDDLRLVTSFADQATAAVQNARLNADLERKNRVLTSLQEATVPILKRLDPPEVLQAILAQAAQMLDTEHGYIYLIRPEANELELTLGTGIFAGSVGAQLQLGEGLAGKVWQSLQPLVVQEYDTWIGRSSKFDHSGIHAVAGIPLYADIQLTGVLGLAHLDATRRFSTNDLELLDRFAQLASLALGNAQFYALAQQQLKERTRAEAALRESEARYKSLFEDSPIALWEEDFSEVKKRLDDLRQAGISDFRDYFKAHPEFAAECASLVKVVDVNKAVIALYKAKEKEELIKNLSNILGVDAYTEFAEELTHIAEGETQFGWEGTNQTLAGDPLEISLSWIVVPSYENTLARVIVSLMDITERKRAENALRESEERLRGLYDNATIGMYRTTPDGRILLSNPASVRMLGFESFEELAKRNLEEDGFEPDYRRREFRGKMERDGVVLGLETQWIRRDGKAIFVRESATAVRDAQGKIIYYDGTFEDITDRKKAEEDLRRSEEKYRLLFENAPVGIFQSTPEGHYLSVNPAMAQIYQYSSPEDMLARVTDIGQQIYVDPTQRKRFQEMLAEKGEVKEFVNQNRRADGSIIWTSTNARAVRDSSGVIQSLEGFITDITERKQAEEKLRESENRYRLATKATKDVIWEWDARSHELIWTENAQAVFGYLPEEIGPDEKWWDEHIHPDDREHVSSTLNALIAGTGSLWQEEYRFLLKDGSYAYVSDHAYIERDTNGEPLRMIGAMSDITPRRRAEEELRQSEARYRAVVETQSEMIVRWKLNGKRTFVNEAYLRCFGLTHNQAISSSFLPLVADSDRNKIEAKIARLNAGQVASETEVHQVLLPGGEIGWQEWTDTAIRDDSGEIVEFQSVGRDVSERIRAERALRESEESYRRLFTEILDGFALHEIICDETGQPCDYRFLDVNPAFERLTGLHATELIGRTVRDVLPGIEPVWIERYGHVALSGEPTHFEEFSGDLGKYYEITAFQYRPKQFATIFVDTTLRKRAEEALQESLKYLEEAEKIAHVGHYKINITTGRASWSKEVFRIFGLEPTENEPTAESYGKLVHPEDRDAVDEMFARTATVGSPFDLVYRIRRSDGEYRFVHSKGEIPKDSAKNAEGGPLEFFGTLQDITERKRAEEAIQLSEKKFKALFEIAPVGISVVDRNLNIIDANYALQRITGFGKAELLNGDYQKRTFLRPDGSVMLPDEFASALALKEDQPIFDVETGIVTDNRGVVWTQVSAAPLNMPDASLVVITQDISERKQAEEALRQRLAELETLYESGLLLGQLLEPKQIGQEIIDVLAEKMDWYHTTVRLYHPETNSLELLAFNVSHVTGEEEWRTYEEQFKRLIARPGDGLSGWVIQHGEAVRCGNVTQDSRYVETVPGLQSGLYVPIKTGERTIGVISVESEKSDYFTAEDEHLAVTLAAQAAVALENIRLFKDLQKSNDDLFRAYDETIEGWSRALDLRDKETEGHTLRVTELTVKLARQMGIPEAEILHIRRGALLHDIGKMGVPDRILLKPDKLTEEEWMIMRMHPVNAYNLLSRVAFLRPALNIPHYHHERWDGSGYPEGLKGNDIPLEARIFAVVDVYDALTSDRPYRPGWPKDQALLSIRQYAGIYFDAQVVMEFLRLIKGK